MKRSQLWYDPIYKWGGFLKKTDALLYHDARQLHVPQPQLNPEYFAKCYLNILLSLYAANM